MARIGRWCFRHRWLTLAMWLLAVTAGALSAGTVFNSLADNNNPRHVESIEAYDTLASATETGGTVAGIITGVDPRDSRTADAISAATAELRDIADVKAVAPPVPSKDGRDLLLGVTLDKVERPARNVAADAISARLHRLGGDLRAGGQQAAEVRVGGGPVLNREANRAVRDDLARAETLSLPLTLVVLVIVFGGLVAAGLPVLAAVVSVAGAMVLLLGFSKVTDLDSNTVTVVSLLGLGLSIDYGLLLVARYREERAAGFDPANAVGRAWATAGRTVLFSALTVAAALAGLLTFEVPGLRALGAGGVLIAVVAMLAALTFTAAMLGITHRWVKPSKRAARRRAHFGDAAEIGLFARLSRFVQHHPVLVALTASVALLVAGIPLLTGTVKLPGIAQIPKSLESVQVANELGSRFGQTQTPAVTVVARTDPATLDSWAARWADRATVQKATPVGGGVSRLDLAGSGDPQGRAAQDLVADVRADRPPNVESWVTGDAAVLVDLIGLIDRGLPWAVGVTLLAMVLLLFAFTGSLVVPVKAILANVVSLGATFGVMYAVFEHGWLAGPLHTITVGGLDPFVIVIVFAFAFGLSMDYEVFLLGRIKEYVDRGWDTDTAVRRGLQHTGRIITSAALLMVIVFACFAGARMGQIEQIGLGLAVAVLIDATVVRCLLVPATMTMLGRWNWWAPAPLARLHARVGLGEHLLPDPVPAPDRELQRVP
jgi:RND superfamily putative drug exporter